jgi:hypothetical protein
MKIATPCNFFCAAAIAALVAGCASTTVRPVYEQSAAQVSQPRRVLVYDFAISTRDVTENQSLFNQAANNMGSSTQTQRELEIAQQVRDRMSEDLVAGLLELGIPAQRAYGQPPTLPNTLVLIGEFENVDEGNRLHRLVIGFGAGGSYVDTRMQLMAPSYGSYRILTQFTTHADSGHMPGAAVTMGAGAAAQGGVTAGMAAANVAAGGIKAYRSDIERMAGRSADQAVAYLSEYFAKQGWISPDKVRSANYED